MKDPFMAFCFSLVVAGGLWGVAGTIAGSIDRLTAAVKAQPVCTCAASGATTSPALAGTVPAPGGAR